MCEGRGLKNQYLATGVSAFLAKHKAKTVKDKQHYSSLFLEEHADAESRPYVEITYETPPAPASSGQIIIIQ